MNWADFLNADSDAIVPGSSDILLFDSQMLGVHCSCTFCLFMVFEMNRGAPEIYENKIIR